MAPRAKRDRAPRADAGDAGDGGEERSHKAKGVRRRRASNGEGDETPRTDLLRTAGFVLIGYAIGYLIRGAFSNGDEASAIEETVKVGTLMNRNTAVFEKALRTMAAEAGELETRVSALERELRKLKASPGGDTTAA